jgi:hypothetical protein
MYRVKQYCACKVEIKRNPVKCMKCDWNYCSRKCRLKAKQDHKVNCGINKLLNQFWDANARFLAVYGMFLKVQPDHSWEGIHLEISDDNEADVKVTAVEDQSLRILLQRVMGEPRLYVSGYPDCFVVIISWSGKMVCYEIDLVKHGSILVGKSPSFANASNEEAGKLIVPPGPASRSETRNQWHTGFEAHRLRRDWSGWAEWQKAVAEIKKMNKNKVLVLTATPALESKTAESESDSDSDGSPREPEMRPTQHSAAALMDCLCSAGHGSNESHLPPPQEQAGII